VAGHSGTLTASVGASLAGWATGFQPSEDDLALARRSLLDTVAVMVAARSDAQAELFSRLGSEAGQWAALAHLLDYDDLHMPSTTHISAVCVPVALSTSDRRADPARAYLAGAGVMARLGTALGWPHYEAGWHATCTAGAPAAAVTAAVALGLDAAQTATAMALAIPAAGGVQRAFGTAAKSLQVGFAADAGVRAAALAAAGATADVRAVEDWLGLVGGDTSAVEPAACPAVPGGLAIKLFPCCYALQRPIAATMEFGPLPIEEVRRIAVRTPPCSLAPLIHHEPATGLEGKFSLEYGIAATLVDGRPGLESFTDDAVTRPEAVRLGALVELTADAVDGDHLLAGEVELAVEMRDDSAVHITLALPPGAPGRPPTDEEFRTKLELCAGSDADALAGLSWDTAAAYLRSSLADAQASVHDAPLASR
jgi:2-methylcitrate dehydratase PrpD